MHGLVNTSSVAHERAQGHNSARAARLVPVWMSSSTRAPSLETAKAILSSRVSATAVTGSLVRRSGQGPGQHENAACYTVPRLNPRCYDTHVTNAPRHSCAASWTPTVPVRAEEAARALTGRSVCGRQRRDDNLMRYAPLQVPARLHHRTTSSSI